MGAVGGSRHYQGGGLGDERGWSCPSCGAENNVPIASGCQVCGAGKPGHRGEPPPPPPAPAEGEEHLGPFDRWALAHPKATLEDAFSAGYAAGFQEALAHPPRQAPRPAPPDLRPEHRINRTIAAALELFRDQVLAGNPEEVSTGEWASAAEITEVLRQLHAHLQSSPEVAHA